MKRQSLFMALILTLILLPVVTYAGSHDGEEFEVSPDAWMENYTLVITDAKNINEAYQAAEAIGREGGHIGVIIPNGVMLGWVPKDKVEALVDKSKIRGIYHEPIAEPSKNSLVSPLSGTAKNAVAFFNEVASGAYKTKKAQIRAQTAKAQPAMLPDALETPPISYMDVMKNLSAEGLSEEKLHDAGIYLNQTSNGLLAPSPGNSDYMVGKVVFNAIFVESIGGIDPNQYTWTSTDRTTIQNEIIAGLSWWANTASNPSTYNVPLTFVPIFYYDSRTQTNYEPIRRSSSQDYLWINQIMAKFGYSSGDKFARTTAFNANRRWYYNTNWSVTSFIGYNPYPAPSTFTNGYFAYAYLRGPYSQLLFRNNGWPTTSYDVVNAHETGHLFGALDEYYQAGYGGCTSCLATSNSVINGNCEYCNPNKISCMMRNNSLSLCGYSSGHIGWRGVQYLSVATHRIDNGVFKDFFAPGEKIQYKTYFCLAGPRLGTRTHATKVRFRAEYYGGSLLYPSTVYDDTGWGSVTTSPPTSTGLKCWIVWWNRTVPTTIQHGPATLNFQLAVNEMGKGAVSDTAKFYVAPGADTTEPAPVTSIPFEPTDEGPFLEDTSLPWER